MTLTEKQQAWIETKAADRADRLERRSMRVALRGQMPTGRAAVRAARRPNRKQSGRIRRYSA